MYNSNGLVLSAEVFAETEDGFVAGRSLGRSTGTDTMQGLKQKNTKNRFVVSQIFCLDEEDYKYGRGDVLIEKT